MRTASLSNARPSKMPDRPIYGLSGKRIWVAGHRGMVGSAVVRRLGSEGCEVVTASRHEADLRDARAVDALLDGLRPDAVVLAAARVGGILANDSYPVEFLNDNLMIASNVIAASARHGVGKLLFLGSSCIYPRDAQQPIREEALLSGPLEPTNQWYAVAKIAGLMLCQAYRREYGHDFISAMPCNLYGPGDNFDVQAGHVIPALMAKACEAHSSGARTLEVWGSGRPRREFLYVEDLADGLVFLLKHYSDEPTINVGTGTDLPIADLARLISEVVGFRGTLQFDGARPDGTPRKVLDTGRLTTLGWRPTTPLRRGLELTYQWYLEHHGREGVHARVGT